MWKCLVRFCRRITEMSDYTGRMKALNIITFNIHRKRLISVKNLISLVVCKPLATLRKQQAVVILAFLRFDAKAITISLQLLLVGSLLRMIRRRLRPGKQTLLASEDVYRTRRSLHADRVEYSKS